MRRRAFLSAFGATSAGLLLEPGEAEQLALFEEAHGGEGERYRKVSRAVDALRSRFGTDAVQPGRMLDDEKDGR